MMKTTVGIVTKDRPDLLNLCIESLAKQTIRPFEIVVVDNGICNKTLPVLDSFRSYFQIQYHQSSGNLSELRNQVLSNTKGDIIAFIDDDCVAERRWIETIQNVLRTDDRKAVIGYSKSIDTNRYSRTEDEIVKKWYESYGLDVHIYDVQQVSTHKLLDTKNFAILTRVVVQYNLRFDVNCPYKHEDVCFGFLLFKKKIPVYFVSEMRVRHKNADSILSLISKSVLVGYYDAKSMKYLKTKMPFYWPSLNGFNFLRFIHNNAYIVGYYSGFLVK